MGAAPGIWDAGIEVTPRVVTTSLLLIASTSGSPVPSLAHLIDCSLTPLESGPFLRREKTLSFSARLPSGSSFMARPQSRACGQGFHTLSVAIRTWLPSPGIRELVVRSTPVALHPLSLPLNWAAHILLSTTSCSRRPAPGASWDSRDSASSLGTPSLLPVPTPLPLPFGDRSPPGPVGFFSFLNSPPWYVDTFSYLSCRQL